MIIMKIDGKNNDLIFFLLYIKLSQGTYMTNDIFLKKIKFAKQII